MTLRTTAVSIADLLRALAAHTDTEVQADRCAALLGYERKAPDQPAIREATFSTSGTTINEAPAPAPAVTGARQPLRASFIAVTSCEVIEQPQAERAATPARTLSMAECQPRQRGALPFVPLVRRARLWPAVRRSLSALRRGRIDVQRIARGMARGELLRVLPRRQRAWWAAELVVVWDCGERMAPYQRDFDMLMRDVRALRGRATLSIYLVNNVPDQVVASSTGVVAAIPAANPGAHVLLLSDLGALALRPEVARRWQALMQQMQQGGAHVVAWVPHSARQVEVASARNAEVYCLDPRGALGAERGRLRNAEQRAAEYQRLAALRETLLTQLAFCTRVERELLRAARSLQSELAVEPGVEGLAWSYRPVVRGSDVSRPLAPEHQAAYRERFAALSPQSQRAALACAQRIHARQGRSTEMLETLVWESHAAPSAKAAEQQQVQVAQRWYAAFRASLREGRSDAQTAEFAADVLVRNWNDATFQSQHSSLLADMWAITGRSDVPGGLHSADLVRVARPSSPLQDYVLLQRGSHLVLTPASYALVQGGGRMSLWRRVEPKTEAASSRLAGPWRLNSLEVDIPQTVVRRWLPLHGDEVELHEISREGASCEIVHQGTRYRITTMQRPAWAREMGRDEYGLYADFHIETKHGRASQHLRWIEPGTFWMGSPDDEPERDDDEGPQHPVTLTQGFWLADTACTQALWKAVMGKNPSHFTGERYRPVESVSWDDVQQFLRKLEALLPGCEASLPSEAQWEYACRAGTTTPFSFGTQITPALINYNGQYPYEGQTKGEYRGHTVEVKSLPANAWGLYEMHGNVWEWCADGERKYDDRAQQDPGGPADRLALRAVRGGSWSDGARRARSACRDADHPGGALVFLGFRFCLRSIEPGQGKSLPGGQAAESAPRDEAPASISPVKRALRDLMFGRKRKR